MGSFYPCAVQEINPGNDVSAGPGQEKLEGMAEVRMKLSFPARSSHQK
jgi:hypothetical protein